MVYQVWKSEATEFRNNFFCSTSLLQVLLEYIGNSSALVYYGFPANLHIGTAVHGWLPEIEARSSWSPFRDRVLTCMTSRRISKVKFEQVLHASTS
jgi:hypothetical protein